ncbi:hypothetical protein D3C84_734850 [compost metagenome]
MVPGLINAVASSTQPSLLSVTSSSTTGASAWVKATCLPAMASANSCLVMESHFRESLAGSFGSWTESSAWPKVLRFLEMRDFSSVVGGVTVISLTLMGPIRGPFTPLLISAM